jgi:hypothetical protein
MRRTAFLGELRASVESAVDEALAPTGRSTRDCPYIEYWFGFYRQQNSAHLEQAARRYAPETASAVTALDYVRIISERARQAATVWAVSGRLTGIPEDVSPATPSLPPLPPSSPADRPGRRTAVPTLRTTEGIRAGLSAGRPLESGTRTRMESVFGTSFSHVRVHDDARGAQLSSALSARAFTLGSDVAFSAGAYRPGTPAGDALIAHELAHVVQQSGSTPSQGPGDETELDSDADRAAFGAIGRIWTTARSGLATALGDVRPRLRSGLRLSRCKGDSGPTAQCECVEDLTFNSTGAIDGSYGIDQYWTTVTPYWGAHKTLGKFDETSGGTHTLGHKFQVVGKVSRKPAPTGSAGGKATFQQMARLTVGAAPPGTAGSWFDDMDYTDAGGGDHHWDPNTEAGSETKSGYPGVRRTIATDKYAYTDPPAISYTPGTTNTYRKLEFDIHFRSAPGCGCAKAELTLSKVQEIQVTNGTPTVVQYP